MGNIVDAFERHRGMDRAASHGTTCALPEGGCEAAVINLLGPPNPKLSRAHDLRYGNRGSLSINTATGQWFDWEDNRGGGLISLIMRHRNIDSKAARAWLKANSDLDPANIPAARQLEKGERIARAIRIWDQSESILGSPAERYLAGRDIDTARLAPALTPALRYHPACPFGADGGHPTMVALLCDVATGEPIGIHRTPLPPLHEREISKRMMGRAAGGAIRFGSRSDERVLCIAEGIETALSVMTAGVPSVWAMGSAVSIRSLPVLAGVDELRIYADHDDAGLGAAYHCAGRWKAAGRRVIVIPSPKKGTDFNDVLRERLADAHSA
jgi:putative DNA primase/helicase